MNYLFLITRSFFLLANHSKKLVFQLVFLIGVSTFLPILELVIAHQMITVLSGSDFELKAESITTLLVILASIPLISLLEYYLKTSRYIFISKLMKEYELQNEKKYTNNVWNYSAALDIFNIISFGIQTLGILVLISIYSPPVGIAQIILTFLVFIAIFRLFSKEIFTQENFTQNLNSDLAKNPGQRAFSRIKATEKSNVFLGIYFFLCAVSSLAFAFENIISTTSLLITILASRFAYSKLKHISSTLMRLARSSTSANFA